MKTSTNCVVPEEVMAFIDGELSDFEVQVVSAHLKQCAECAGVAAEFRETSRMLSEWTVPATAATPDDFAVALSETAIRRGALGKKRALAAASRSHGNGKFWAMGCGLLAASLFLLVFLNSASRHVQMEQSIRMALRSQALDSSEHIGSSVMASTAGDSQVSSSPGSPVAKTRLDGSDAKAYVPGILAATEAQPIPAPMIARIVSLSIVVKNVSVSRSTVDGILALHHGYSAQLSVQNPENLMRSFTASLRIPAPHLDAALAELKTLGRVENETQFGEEVTQQHMDLVARLTNSRETEERLQAILRQRTGSVADVLKVENEIARVRGEIEGMEAEQKTLEHRVDFATVELQLMEEYKAQLNAPADSVSTRMHNAFVAGFRNASGTVLGILLFLEEFGPVIVIWLVILGLPLLLLWRRYRKTH